MSAVWVWTIVGLTVTATVVVVLFIAIRARRRRLRRDITRALEGSLESSISQKAEIMVILSDYRGSAYHLRRRTPVLRRRKKSKDDYVSSADDHAVSRAVREAIKKGLLMFNPPAEMIQGQKERVEVGIARSTDLRKALRSGLHGRGKPQFEEIDTSLYMETKLSGPTFKVTSYSPSEQLVVPTARWEFDVLPCRAGHRTITLSINMRIEAKGIVGGRKGVSVVDREIDVQVNASFAVRYFVTNNWQWLIPTVLTLAGTLAAWLVVPF